MKYAQIVMHVRAVGVYTMLAMHRNQIGMNLCAKEASVCLTVMGAKLLTSLGKATDRCLLAY